MHFAHQLKILASHVGDENNRPRTRDAGCAEPLDSANLDRAAESRLIVANLLKDAGANFYLSSVCLIS